ncbi:MAG: DUF3179 domain-containing protein [Candidatus Binataceae bacterium]
MKTTESKMPFPAVAAARFLSGLLRCSLVIILYTFLTGFDLTHHSVPPDQILGGGPPKDGIPAILQPKFVSAASAAFLMPDDRVIGVFVEGKARAYPLKILNWHEVVDDQVAGRSFAVTYCPLTASAIVYDRKLGTKPLTLAVSGKLYESNLLFYDKSTESLWSQIKGEAIAGPLTGRRLDALPSVVAGWAVWRKAHPDTLVLDVNTGYLRNYGIDPYRSYESSSEVMFPVSPTDERLPAKERVLGLTINGADEAFPLSRLAGAKPLLKVDLGGRHVTVIFDAPTQTAGAVLAGRHIPAYTGYWFAWAAFHPKTAIWKEPGGDKANEPKPTGNRGGPQSGVYGFSGTADKRGVVGECIWIYDPLNQKQVASGGCSASKPGEFRVPLAAGDYVVRGPGGNRAVEIKNGRWTRVDSVVVMPGGLAR